MAALHDGHSLVAQSAAIGLGLLGDRQALPHLLAALQTGDLAIRVGAAEGLGHLRDSAAVEALIAALGDRSAVRFAAVLALGNIGDPGAVEALRQLAAIDQAQTYNGESLADAAAVVVGVVGGDWQREVLVRIVRTSQDWRLDEWATRGLARLADPDAIDLLINLLQSVEDYQRLHAAVVLGQTGAWQALDVLEEVAATDAGMLADGRTIAAAAHEAMDRIRHTKGDT